MVTLLVEDENDFWQAASSESLNEIWDNEEDDVYAELLNDFAFQPVSTEKDVKTP